MNYCTDCGEGLRSGQIGYCDCCLYVERHPGVIQNNVDFSFWLMLDEEERLRAELSVEIESVERAIEKAWSFDQACLLMSVLCELKEQLRKLL